MYDSSTDAHKMFFYILLKFLEGVVGVIIQNLKNNKASGNDKIFRENLKFGKTY